MPLGATKQGKTTMNDNPYLLGTNRPSDVLVGIQFLGTYRFYKVGFDYWNERIKVKPKSADSWEELFREHPEFFRVSDEEQNICLILRRARSKSFNVDTGETITRDERKALSDKEKERISREPLSTSDVATLMTAAMELHSRSIAQQQESRWYISLIPSFVGLSGVIIGVIIAAVLG